MTDLSRRSLIATAATLPALAVPAVAVTAETDPIFGAIERYWEADATLSRTDEKEVQAYKLAEKVFFDAQERALDTVPTTLAGMRTKIDFVVNVSHNVGSIPERSLSHILDTLYRSASLIAVKS